MKKNRDAGDKIKGITLQKARATYRVLKSINDSPTLAKYFYTYVALEADDDVNFVCNVDGVATTILEQNKDLTPTTALTLNSSDVVKSLVNFIDCLIERRESPTVLFCFYTTTGFTKEGDSERSKRLKLEFPEQPILKLLENHQLSEEVLKEILIPFVKDCYELEYSKEKKGNLGRIVQWTIEDWRSFFDRIEWVFDASDSEELDSLILREIRRSPFYNSNLSGRETQIAASIDHALDRKMISKDFAERFLHVSEVALIFLEASLSPVAKSDPSWTLLEALETTDARNMEAKFRSVCPSPRESAMKHYKLLVTEAIADEHAQEFSRSYKSEKYQIFAAANEYVALHRKPFADLDFDVLNEHLDTMVLLAQKRILEDRKDYSYPLTDKVAIRNIVFNLFDECYLAFD